MSVLVSFLFFVFLYCLPWCIASTRRHVNTPAIAALNILAGWTVVGWIGAFVWACTANVKPPEVDRRHFLNTGSGR